MFCAVMFTYNKLLNDSELGVMRAVGLGQFGLATPALIVAAATTLVLYVLSLYFLPVSHRAFKDLYSNIRSDYYNMVLHEGAFQELIDGVTVYIRERAPSGELVGILVHDRRKPKNPATYMAERGALVQTDEGPRVVLVKGHRQTVDKDSRQLSMLYFDKYTVEVDLARRDTGGRWHEPRERFIDELFFPDDSEADRVYAKQIKAEGHQRVVGPLYALAFSLIGLACLLHGDFSRRGQVRRVLLAILLTTLVQASGLGLQNLGAKHTLAVPFMYLVAVLPMAVAALLLGRPPRLARRIRPPEVGAVA
jgi:lipopolysaccharide export system permease protein